MWISYWSFLKAPVLSLQQHFLIPIILAKFTLIREERKFYQSLCHALWRRVMFQSSKILLFKAFSFMRLSYSAGFVPAELNHLLCNKPLHAINLSPHLPCFHEYHCYNFAPVESENWWGSETKAQRKSVAKVEFDFKAQAPLTYYLSLFSPLNSP